MKKSASECLKNKNSAVCLAKLAVKIAEDVTVLPAEIVKDGKTVLDLVKHIKPEITKCGSDAVSTCKNQGQALLSKISKCVENKIIHH